MLGALCIPLVASGAVEIAAAGLQVPASVEFVGKLVGYALGIYTLLRIVLVDPRIDKKLTPVNKKLDDIHGSIKNLPCRPKQTADHDCPEDES